MDEKTIGNFLECAVRLDKQKGEADLPPFHRSFLLWLVKSSVTTYVTVEFIVPALIIGCGSRVLLNGNRLIRVDSEYK